MGATPADSESNLTDEGKTRAAARSRGARQPAPRASLPSPFDPVTREWMERDGSWLGVERFGHLTFPIKFRFSSLSLIQVELFFFWEKDQVEL